MIHGVLRLSFPVYNSLIRQLIDLHCTLIGHFRALYQMHLSLGVDVGRGGSPNHQQI